MFETRVAPAERLVDAVEELLASPSVELAPIVALERLGTVLSQSERLTLVALDGVADLDNRELYALDGSGSAVGWLRARRVGGDPRLRSLARALTDRPAVRDAVVAGALGMDAAQKVCTALGQVPFDASENGMQGVFTDGVRDAFQQLCGGGADPAAAAELARLTAAASADVVSSPDARLEPVFVFLAQRVNPPVLARTLRDLVEAVQPDMPDEAFTEPYEEEYFELQQVLDGYWHVKGLLSPETGAVLDAELNRRLETIPSEPERIRSVSNRRAEALRSLAADGREGDGNATSRPSADLTIIARAETLAGCPGSPPARLSDGTRISLAAARRLGCDSRIMAVVLDATGKPLAASGTHRHATKRERQALHAQWGGCAVDGCAQPFSRTRPHHVIPWWLSKITRLKDLAPVCEHHHHDIHEGNRILRLRDGRCISPRGWVDLCEQA